MLLFRSEETVDAWCAARGRERGALLTQDQLWHLAVVWYAERLSPESRRLSPAEVHAVFAAAGLVGPFWALG